MTKDHDRFIRLESGLLFPRAALPQREREKRAFFAIFSRPARIGLSRAFNFMSVLIQLATVVVLWMTFENTVVPIQQKELLAEQVAGLERERNKTIADIEAGRIRMKALNDQLALQEQALGRLQNERAALEAEAKSAADEAQAAKRSEQLARAQEEEAKTAAQTARRSLGNASWRILAEEAQWQILRASASFRTPRALFQNAVDDANAAGKDSGLTAEQRVARDIDAVDQGWPNISQLVKLTAHRIRGLRSPHYTEAMTREFAAEFEREGASFVCNRPDFDEIRAKYIRAINEAKLRTTRDQSIGREYVVLSELSRELVELPKDCSDRFSAIGVRFLEEKNKSPQKLPDDIDY